MKNKSILDINLKEISQKIFFPSPSAWEDHVLYFLMLDRFSDGNEKGYLDNNGKKVTTGKTPLFKDSDKGNAVKTLKDKDEWIKNGTVFVGGTLKGLESKMGYLKRLGITALWVSPIFKQVAYDQTYHGYGIQNFLEVDSRFGTKEDLVQMVKTAHENGIYVILDIILNHSGDVFEYDIEKIKRDKNVNIANFGPQYNGSLFPVSGFKNKDGNPVVPFIKYSNADTELWPDGAIWPIELQDPETFSQKGFIKNWDDSPEYLDGDFFNLKNINLGKGSEDNFIPSGALLTLSEVFKYWIALADIDGFRLDTVKHMDVGATRFFTSVIHEFTQSIGKENFYIMGEITGGRKNACEILEKTGLNAALGINDIPDKLEYLVKGYRNPSEYFDLFRNSFIVQKESHTWFKNKIVTTFDDHDQIRKGKKARFCYDEVPGQNNKKLLLNVLALNIMTLGIPCIYYGTEQSFDGHGECELYIRESMFGGNHGAFESKGRHFFNEEGEVYRELSEIIRIRKDRLTLRRGRQYLNKISENGVNFSFPTIRDFSKKFETIISWSRLFNNESTLLAINTDIENDRSYWISLEHLTNNKVNFLTCIYSTNKKQIGEKLKIEDKENNAVLITVPAAGFVIFE